MPQRRDSKPKGNTFAYCLSLQYLIRFRGEVNRMVNEELLFRGLPWGINIDEARALLNLPDLESLQLKDAVSSQYSVYGFQGHRVAASANSHYKNKGLVHQLWRWYSDEDSRPRIAEKMLEAIYLFSQMFPRETNYLTATVTLAFMPLLIILHQSGNHLPKMQPIFP